MSWQIAIRAAQRISVVATRAEARRKWMAAAAAEQIVRRQEEVEHAWQTPAGAVRIAALAAEASAEFALSEGERGQAFAGIAAAAAVARAAHLPAPARHFRALPPLRCSCRDPALGRAVRLG